MHYRGLDLNLLAALDVLLQEKNTTRAAERLCLSQPAVSGALARLREYFNDELLAPAGRGLVLTPLAESLVEPVSDLLRQFETRIAARARFDAATSTRRFTVMGSDYALTVLMPRALQRIGREAPGITCALRQTTLAWQEELTRGAVDFVMIPEIYTTGNHPREPLFQEDFTCVVWAENDRIGASLSREQYLDLGHVAVAFGSPSNLSIEQTLLQQAGCLRRIEVIASNFTMLPLLLPGTNRIATMHTRLARLAAGQLPLRLLPLPIELPRMTEMLQWPAHLREEPGCLWLRKILEETAAEL